MADSEEHRAGSRHGGRSPAGQSVRERAGSEKERGGTAVEEREASGSRMKEEARRQARELQNAARSEASRLTDEARERARGARKKAEQKADRWSSTLGRHGEHLAHALRTASGTLQEEGEDTMAELAEGAARQVERVSEYLEEEDSPAMMHDLEDAGRRAPATFLGTSFTLGLAVGRFFRASSPSNGSGKESSEGNGRASHTPTRASGGGEEREDDELSRPVGGYPGGRRVRVKASPPAGGEGAASLGDSAPKEEG